MVETATATWTDVERALREALGGNLLESTDNRGQLIIRTRPARRPEALRILKDAGFTYHVFVSAVDWPDERRLEVLDHVYSVDRRQRVTLKCDVTYDDPRVPTATTVYRGADWHEREAWELFGVVFTGHPRLRRLLLPDWFEGFPMRKGYSLEPRLSKPWPGAAFEG